MKSPPTTYVPKAMRRAKAAAYVGVSPNTFDRLVEQGILPRSKPLGPVRVWDRDELDAAIEALGEESDPAAPPNMPSMDQLMGI